MQSPLNRIIKKYPIVTPNPSSNWVLPDQYIGIEIETERMPDAPMRTFNATPSSWASHNDPSLRDNGIEFTLRQPLMGEQLSEAISYFFRTFNRPWRTSGRTSTHLHINMQQDTDTVEVLQAMVAIYYALENAWFKVVGEERKWSGYCHPLDARQTEVLQYLFSDSEASIREWYDTLSGLPHQGSGRYYGLNLLALNKYGTVEFRHFPCVTSEEQLIGYVTLVMELKAAAIAVANSGRNVFTYFAEPEAFLNLATLMPRWGSTLLSHTNTATLHSRLGKLAVYNLPRSEGTGMHIVNNKAFAGFLAAKGEKKLPANKIGKKSSATFRAVLPSRIIPPSPDPDFSEMVALAERARQRQREQRLAEQSRTVNSSDGSVSLAWDARPAGFSTTYPSMPSFDPPAATEF